MSCYEKQNNVEVSLEYPLFQSKKGRYFIGETPIIGAANKQALCLLVNPITSNVNLYLNAMTITNLSPDYLLTKFYLGPSVSGGLYSSSISCTNLSTYPLPNPTGKIEYFDNSTKPSNKSVSIFSRIIPPLSTTVIDGGQIIISPGNSIGMYLAESVKLSDSIIFAYGWWESPINNCCCSCI